MIFLFVKCDMSAPMQLLSKDLWDQQKLIGFMQARVRKVLDPSMRANHYNTYWLNYWHILNK